MKKEQESAHTAGELRFGFARVKGQHLIIQRYVRIDQFPVHFFYLSCLMFKIPLQSSLDFKKKAFLFF